MHTEQVNVVVCVCIYIMHRTEFSKTRVWLETVTAMPCTEVKNLEQMQKEEQKIREISWADITPVKFRKKYKPNEIKECVTLFTIKKRPCTQVKYSRCKMNKNANCRNNSEWKESIREVLCTEMEWNVMHREYISVIARWGGVGRQSC